VLPPHGLYDPHVLIETRNMARYESLTMRGKWKKKRMRRLKRKRRKMRQRSK